VQVSLPSLYGSFPVFRQIMLRERIGIVHGHQASSVIGHECLMHAKTMGIPTCFTDHSLLGFADAASIHLNKVLVWSLCDIDHSICVSHTSKENTVLRAGVDPQKVISARSHPSPPLFRRRFLQRQASVSVRSLRWVGCSPAGLCYP